VQDSTSKSWNDVQFNKLVDPFDTFDNMMSEVQENEDMESEKVQDDSYADVIFGKRRPDAMILDKPDKTILVLEFKRTSDQGSDYREARAEKQHKVLVARTTQGHLTKPLQSSRF